MAIQLPSGIESYPDTPVSSASRMIARALHVHCAQCTSILIARALYEQSPTKHAPMANQRQSNECILFHITYILIKKIRIVLLRFLIAYLRK